jgi:hypothetical protein
MDISKFDNLHAGQRGFVIGGGPSIKLLLESEFSPELLHNEIVIGANKAYKFCDLTYLVSIDTNFIRGCRDEVRALSCPKFFPEGYLRGYEEDNTVYPMANRLQDYRGNRAKLPNNFNDICYVGGSGSLAVKVAYSLGCDPIYLLGIDCTLWDGRSHFHDDYETPLPKKTVEGFFPTFYGFIHNMINARRRVYSCSPISKLNDRVCPYIDIRELFNDATAIK